jgi:cell division septum initiation protein DivIVA
MRGYHPEDVDHFLEEVAAGLETLQDRIRQAVERAQRAEAAAAEAGGNDEALRKTLVLAQRTADMAVQEAREQAARILAGAEHQAQSLLADAEERSRRTIEDVTADARAELARLETSRAEAQRDVDSLNRWLDEHKAHLVATLREATEAVERAGVMWPAPSTRPIEVPGLQPGQTQSDQTQPDQAQPNHAQPNHAQSNHAQPGQNQAPSETEAEPTGATDETTVWAPVHADQDHAAPNSDHSEHSNHSDPPSSAFQTGENPVVASDAPTIGAGMSTVGPRTDDAGDDRALDDFFEDGDDELEEDHRFGGRLRRRR